MIHKAGISLILRKNVMSMKIKKFIFSIFLYINFIMDMKGITSKNLINL